MGKIYNGINTNVTDVDNPKELDEMIGILNNIGTWVCDRDDVKFRDDKTKKFIEKVSNHSYTRFNNRYELMDAIKESLGDFIAKNLRNYYLPLLLQWGV